MADIITDQQLTDFKSHMHITHKAEDPYLKMLLNQAAAWVTDVVDDASLNNPQTLELVYERARYAYNDKLGDFDKDYQSLILDRAISTYEPKEVDWNGDSTD